MTATATPRAFHGDPAIKKKYVKRMRKHRRLDQIVQGMTFDPETREGCLVGCTFDRYDHAAYPVEIGYPEPLGRLLDAIFEGLPSGEEGPDLALASLERVREGADLTGVVPRFLAWLLGTRDVIPATIDPGALAVCDRVAGLYRREVAGEWVGREEWLAARSAADAALSADAADAVWSAANADVARSAADAARSAANAAKVAAADVASVADDAAWVDATEAAWAAAFRKMGAKLLDLMAAAAPAA
jgi:hypothetical protein